MTRTSGSRPIERTPERIRGFVKQRVLQLRAIVQRVRQKVVGPVRIMNASRQADKPGALLSYLAAPLRHIANDPRLGGHTNAWESATIGRSIESRGYMLDAIDWSDDAFTTSRDYTLVFDIHRNLARVADRAAIRWMHLTGAHPRFARLAEGARLAALSDRRGVRLSARRSFDDAETEKFERSMAAANVVTILGDAVTASTFKGSCHAELERVFVTASALTPRARNDDFDSRTFLWFGGSGAVHKGLDLVLETFARQPHLKLHCVGPYERERDFVAAYARELYATPNITSHGWMLPSDGEFSRLASKAFAFVLPSCSEGMSTAAATCMRFGLIPIVTRRCGLDLPGEIGRLLTESGDDLDRTVNELAEVPRASLAGEIERTKALAEARHSREAFGGRMRDLLSKHLVKASG